MTTEQKAQAYDEAIERAKSLYDYNQPISASNVIINNIFPELKESEDEKIRKKLIDFLEYYRLNNVLDSKTILLLTDSIAWLEKQGEQKETLCDKLEPKFKVGEWIYHEISGNAFHINRIENRTYISDEGATISFGRQNDWKLWTIQDAKDGDVLSNGKMIVIFKHFAEPSCKKYIVAHIGLDTRGNIQITGDTWNLGVDKTKPATKEQCDLLFAKMKESGYLWDGEKIQQNKDMYKTLTDFENSLKHIMEEAIECGDTHNLKADADMLLRVAQNTAKSE